MVERLDAVVEAALKSMVRDLHTSVWCRREREIVNLFVLGHLIALCGANGVLHDPMQIGIESAVPQLPGRGGHRKVSQRFLNFLAAAATARSLTSARTSSFGRRRT